MSWVKASNGEIPANALVVGYEEDGSPLYAARAEHEGGHHPGKVSRALGAVHFGFSGKEMTKREYEVLCCNPRELSLVHWVRMEKGHAFPERAWVAGKEHDGHELYIARGKIGGGLHPGKAGTHLKDSVCLSHSGEEHQVSPFEVLVFQDQLTLSKMILSRLHPLSHGPK